MSERSAMLVDYQTRAEEFAFGDMVESLSSLGIFGRVTAVYPAIGMVDVEWPTGNTREPVESLQRFIEGDDATPPRTQNTPGGVGKHTKGASVRRVAEAFVKKALYWAAPDRHYRATKEECDSEQFTCPKCKKAILKPASYQRANGASEKLFACPKCLFLIKRCDIIGHPEYVDDQTVAKKAQETFKRVRLTGSV